MDSIKQLLVKKPFVRIKAESPTQSVLSAPSTDLSPRAVNDGRNLFDIYTQDDFLREYYPTGHKIYDRHYYPDRVRKDPETGKVYIEYVIRCAFSFQQVIALKHTITLCGNDIQFSLSTDNPSETDNANFYEFQRGWETHDMEIAWYESARSAKSRVTPLLLATCTKGLSAGRFSLILMATHSSLTTTTSLENWTCSCADTMTRTKRAI